MNPYSEEPPTTKQTIQHDPRLWTNKKAVMKYFGEEGANDEEEARGVEVVNEEQVVIQPIKSAVHVTHEIDIKETVEKYKTDNTIVIPFNLPNYGLEHKGIQATLPGESPPKDNKDSSKKKSPKESKKRSKKTKGELEKLPINQMLKEDLEQM